MFKLERKFGKWYNLNGEIMIDLNELNIKKEIIIDIDVYKDDDLDKRIINLKNSHVKGRIFNNVLDIIELDLQFTGEMIIADSITLEPISYPFTIKIQDDINEIKENFPDTVDFTKNTLDILLLLWENIVLEVPISYTTSSDAKISGNGWELKNDNNKDEIDPRLEKLNQLLKGDD